MIETWKPIERVNGNYKVSSLGRVKGPRGMVACYAQKSGYLYVNLYFNGKNVCLRVHRLVAEAFCIKASSELNVVDHINGDKTDNRACNLEWVSSSENVRRAEAACVQVHHHNFHFKRPVIGFNGVSRVFESLAEAARCIGTSRSVVSKVCKGIYPSIKGWTLRYDRSGL